MFGFVQKLFKAQCPLTPEDQKWVEGRFDWLRDQFQRDFITILPTKDFFPGNYDGSDETIENMFWRVCRCMNIPKQEISLHLFDAGEAGGIYLDGGNAAGLYYGGYPFEVGINTFTRTSQTATVATIAHELCHVRLMGEGRVEPDIPDNEELTDLATIFYGFGIFTANSKFQKTSKGWTSMGYLPNVMINYTIAYRQYLLGGRSHCGWNTWPYLPTLWLEYLAVSPQSVCKRSMRYLRSTKSEGEQEQ